MRGTAESIASTQVKDGGGWKDCTHFASLVDKPNTESMDYIYRQTNHLQTAL